MDIAHRLLDKSPIKPNPRCVLMFALCPYCHTARAASKPVTGFYSMEKLNDHTHIFHRGYLADVLNSKPSTLLPLPAVSSFGGDSTTCQGQ